MKSDRDIPLLDVSLCSAVNMFSRMTATSSEFQAASAPSSEADPKSTTWKGCLYSLPFAGFVTLTTQVPSENFSVTLKNDKRELSCGLRVTSAGYQLAS